MKAVVPALDFYSTLFGGHSTFSLTGHSCTAEWDFLVDYYPFSPSTLSIWHPGYPVLLEGSGAEKYVGLSGYVEALGGVRADIGFLAGKLPRLSGAIRVLQRTLSRPAITVCFGLHEWAMTYKLSQQEVRHSSLPLRLSSEDVAQTVEAIGVRCTHIDAYRIFTPAAIPLNSLEPTRASQPDLEQPGCLHAAMDL